MNAFRNLAAAALAALPLLLVAPASAQDFPSKPIRIVVPYAAGGSTDALARLMGEKLTQRLGQSVVVDNRPGASEQIATVHVKQSPADGYTLLLSTLTGLAVNPGLYKARLAYDPLKDLAPVQLTASVPSVVVVHPSVPARTLPELGAWLKANTGRVAYASAGNGTPSHLAMELYKRQTQTDPAHVPYKGGAPALQDVAGGQAQLMIALVPEAMPLVKAGRLRALAVTSEQRLAQHPELPTVREALGTDFDATFWYAFVAPAGTPAAIVTRLNTTLNAILQEPDVAARLSDMSLTPVGGAPSRVTERIRADGERWRRVIDEAGIKIE